MSLYSPLSYKAAGVVAKYRGVALSAAETVNYPTTVTSSLVGVTVDESEAANEHIPVAFQGIRKLHFNDTVAAAGLVAIDASGRGIPFAGVTLVSSAIIGQLVGPAVAATGTVAEIFVNPQLRYGQD